MGRARSAANSCPRDETWDCEEAGNRVQGLYSRGGPAVAGRRAAFALRERVPDETEESAFSGSELESAWVSALGFSAHVFFSRCLFFITLFFI